MQRPTAVPMIPASASGVSTQRSGPNLSRRPAVARKTPPARPTSSPITITFSSRPSSTWKQSLIASSSVSSLIAEHPLQLGQIVGKRGRRIGERMLEEERDVGRRLGLGGGDPVSHGLFGLGANGRGHLVRQDPGAAHVALEPPDALPSLLFLDALEIDVGLRIVRRRVGGGAVR